jgi:hypothetical protein
MRRAIKTTKLTRPNRCAQQTPIVTDEISTARQQQSTELRKLKFLKSVACGAARWLRSTTEIGDLHDVR